ncbi:MAG: hypothetical protein K5695_05575 [Oscillospiraceae bacterium]|nr:hypothetical protein [Oscillospiraceae bacterium]
MHTSKITRTAAAALTAVLVMNALTGCGMGQSKKKGGLDVSLDHSYSATPLGFEKNESTSTESLLGDNLLVSTYDDKFTSHYVLYNVTDGSTKEVDLGELGQGKDGVTNYVSSVISKGDGGVTFLISSYREVEEEEEYSFENLGMRAEVFDAAMNHTGTKQLSSGDDDEMSYGEIMAGPNETYYTLKWDDAGNPTLTVLDADFKEVGAVSGDYTYVENVMLMKDGAVYVSYQDKEYNSCFGRLDPQTNQISKMEIADMPSWCYGITNSNDPKYALYMRTTDGLFGVNVEQNKCEEVINWVNSDFVGSNLDDVYQLSDGTFLVSEYGMGEGDYGNIWKLSPRDPAELKNVKMISLATLDLTENLARSVNKFNRSQSEYRIAIANYGKYNTEEDYEGGLKQLQNDMIAGIVADLIVADSLPYESFCNKGLFADLSDRVAGLSSDEYFTNFFDSMRYGDKLYRMGFSYSVRTMIAKQSKVNKQGMSTADFTDIISNLPKDTKAMDEMNRAYASYMLLYSNSDAFIDREHATCSFNSPEFVKLLEIVKECPEDDEDHVMTEEENQKYWDEKTVQYINDKVIFYPTWINDLYQSYEEQFQYFDKAPVTYCGYPTLKEGSNGSSFQPDFTLAVSANSQYQDKCWEFLSSMLTDEYQDNLSWALPVKKSSFDKQAEAAMKPATYYDYELGKEAEYERTIYRGEQEVKIPDMPKSYIEDVKKLISGINETTYYDQKVSTIIEEESQKFFAGDQSAQQAADMIQSSVSLYLSEQK